MIHTLVLSLYNKNNEANSFKKINYNNYYKYYYYYNLIIIIETPVLKMSGSLKSRENEDQEDYSERLIREGCINI